MHPIPATCPRDTASSITYHDITTVTTRIFAINTCAGRLDFQKHGMIGCLSDVS